MTHPTPAESRRAKLARMNANYHVLSHDVSRQMSIVLGAVSHLGEDARAKVAQAMLAYGEVECRRFNLAARIREIAMEVDTE